MQRDIQYRFGRLLTVTTRAWSTYLDQQLSPLGLTGPRWHLLVELANLKEPPSQTELASLLNIESASLIKMLDAMEKADLLRRVPHKTDRRTKIIEITKGGRKVMDSISAIAKDVRKVLLDGVPPEDMEVCMRVFSVIGTNLEKV
jgi:MarR family transcriptional regulator, transcriptional regulator for hemolysin